MNVKERCRSLTLSSLRLVSGSYVLPASALPLLDEVPPSEARVAGDRPGVVQRDDGWGRQNKSTDETQLHRITRLQRRTLHASSGRCSRRRPSRFPAALQTHQTSSSSCRSHSWGLFVYISIQVFSCAAMATASVVSTDLCCLCGYRAECHCVTLLLDCHTLMFHLPGWSRRIVCRIFHPAAKKKRRQVENDSEKMDLNHAGIFRPSRVTESAACPQQNQHLNKQS